MLKGERKTNEASPGWRRFAKDEQSGEQALTFSEPVRASWRAESPEERRVEQALPAPRSHHSNRKWSRRTVGNRPGHSNDEPSHRGNRLAARPTYHADPRSHRRGSCCRRGRRTRQCSRANDFAVPRSRRRGSYGKHERRHTSEPPRRHNHCDGRMPNRRPDSSSPSSTQHCTFNQPPARNSDGNTLNSHPLPPSTSPSLFPEGLMARLIPVDCPKPQPKKAGHAFGVLKIVNLDKLKVNSKLG